VATAEAEECRRESELARGAAASARVDAERALLSGRQAGRLLREHSTKVESTNRNHVYV